ncbi:MAG: hypothetical protein V5789_04565 [Colwellia sp.]
MSTIDRRNVLKSAAVITAASITAGYVNTKQQVNSAQLKAQGSPVMGLVVPKTDVVRVGFIGVGQRVSGHVKHYCHLDGVVINAVYDTAA